MCFSDDVDSAEWNLDEFNSIMLPIIPVEPLTTDKVKDKRKDEIKHLREGRSSEALRSQRGRVPGSQSSCVSWSE